MSKRAVLTAVLALTITSAAQADILWNNYPGDSYVGDPTMALSSERDTLIDQTWTVDDAVFDFDVQIESVRWVGMREDVDQYDYPFADLIILDSDLQEYTLLEGLDYNLLWQSGGPQLETYEASIGLDQPIALPAGQYYFGLRLVGDAQLGVGRNYIAAASDVNPAGQTGGYFWGPMFGIFDWLPVEDMPFIDEPRDYAFQVQGVPEPGSLALLFLGSGLAWPRRR